MWYNLSSFICDVTSLPYVWHDSFSYVWRDSFLYVWRDSFSCVWRDTSVTWLLFYVCDMTPSSMGLVHMCDMYVWHESYMTCMCDMNHSYVRDMIHSYVWHDLCMCGTWLIHVYDMTHWYAWHDSFMCVAWLIHMCGMTHSYGWHDSFIRVAWLIHMCDMTLHMCGMTHCREMIAGKGRLSQIFALSYVCMCDMTSLHTCVTRFLFICVW